MDTQLIEKKAVTPENEYEIWKTSMDDYIISIGWSFNDNYMVAASSSGKVSVFNAANQSVKSTINAHRGALMNLALSPSENLAITTGQDGAARLWNIDSGILIKELKLNALWVEHVAWSHDGNCFAVSAGNEVHVFNSKGDYIQQFNGHESTVSGVAWKSDNTMFASACYGGIRLFELGKSEPIQFLEWKNSMLSVSWSPDDKFICCGTQDSRIHFFPLPYTPETDFEMTGYKGKVKILDWTNDSRFFLTNCWSELVVWEVNGKPPVGGKPVMLRGNLGRITAAKFQHKGAFMVSGDEIGLLLFYHLESGDTFIAGAKIKDEVSCLSWSHSDTFLAVGTNQGEIILMESPA